MRRTLSPVTELVAERGAVDEVELVSPSASSVPQSASGIWKFAVAATGWPSTTRPVICDEPTSPVAPATPAAAPARIEIDSAVISPPSNDTASARTLPSADDEVPAWAVTLAVDAPIRIAEPSSGYENGPPALAVGGASSPLVALAGTPGSVTEATSAVAPVVAAVGSDGAAPATPATSTPSARASTSDARALVTTRQGTVAAPAPP